jgi:deazaflavin-dependent oxidoreductase (nitroreductase family)
MPTVSGPARHRLSRALVRAPILLYRCGLGGLLRGRMVLLTHTGRITGLPRQVVLEVVGRGAEPDTYVVASGYGTRAQWYRNVVAEPRVIYQVGRRRVAGWACPLPAEESGRVLTAYAGARPRTAAALMGMIGHDVDGSGAAYARLGADPERGVPLVLLAPTPNPPAQVEVTS